MSVNFSSTTPAAPSGSTNVTFQTDGSGNVSAYAPSSSSLLPGIDQTGKTADIAAADLLTSPSNASYRVSAYIIVTTAGSVSSTLPSVVITWTDRDNGQAQTLTLTATSSGNSLTTYKQAEAVISASTASAIQYSTTGYATSAAGMTYAVRIRIEQL